MQKLKFVRLREGAKLPTRGSPKSAGLDVTAAFEAPKAKTIIGIGCRALIPTGLALAEPLPDNTYLRVAPRSGLALNHGLHVMAGVVDGDYLYPKEIGVVLLNTDDKEVYVVQQGDRVAQLILESYVHAEAEECAPKAHESGRLGGFGSTGR